MKQQPHDKEPLPPELAALSEQAPIGEPERIGSIMPEVLQQLGLNDKLKALPTMYGGIQYRSRLEARWAIFFDTLQIKFDYEPEGFDLGNGLWYLPDFWLPTQQCYIEIKPTQPNAIEDRKADALSELSGHSVFLFYDAITTVPRNAENDLNDEWIPKSYCYPAGGGGCDMPYMWCECQDCGLLGIRFDGRSDRLPCKVCWKCMELIDSGYESRDCCTHKCKRHGGNWDKGYNYSSARLVMAYRTARAERFIR